MNFSNPCPATNAWLNLLRKIFVLGKIYEPRGQRTLEILGNKTTVDMEYPIVDVPARKIGKHFMMAEAAWILSGDNRVSTIKPFSSSIKDFSDDGVRFFGAYGPRVIDQLGHVVKSLVDDQNSRQAVITMWRPNPPKSKDIPCTISAQWMIRDKKLHCFMNMRSSDIWLGVPYDWFNFSCLSMGIALRLRDHDIYVDLGPLHFNVASQHLYMRNFDAAKEILEAVKLTPIPPDTSKAALKPHLFNSYDHLVDLLWDMAKDEADYLGWMGESK